MRLNLSGAPSEPTVRRDAVEYAAHAMSVAMPCLSLIAPSFRYAPNAVQNALSRVKILRLAAARMRIIKSRAALKSTPCRIQKLRAAVIRLCGARRAMFRVRADSASKRYRNMRRAMLR